MTDPTLTWYDIAKSRLAYYIEDVPVYPERMPHIDQASPCIILRGGGGEDLTSAQGYLGESPVLDMTVYVDTGKLNDAYRIIKRVAQAMRAMSCLLVTGPVPIPTANESAPIRAVNVSYRMFTD